MTKIITSQQQQKIGSANFFKLLLTWTLSNSDSHENKGRSTYIRRNDVTTGNRGVVVNHRELQKIETLTSKFKKKPEIKK